MHALSLREELFLLAHDDGGRPLAPEAGLGVGLAGATLVDLLLQRRVAVGDGRLDVLDSTATGDAESDATLEAIAANTAPCGPRAWVSWISHGAYERTAEALHERGVIRREVVRRLGLLPVGRCVPVATDDLVRVRSRVRFAVNSRDLPEPATAALCGLVRVLRLEGGLLLSMPTADLLIGLERTMEASGVTVRQVIHAVDAVVSTAAYR